MNLFQAAKPTAGAGGAPGAGGGAALGYDRMGVPGPDGAVRWLTKGEFERLPLIDRVRILSAGEATFFRQGQQISPREALKS